MSADPAGSSSAPRPPAAGRQHAVHYDPALDFLSPLFDPLAALAAAGLLPPVPHARPLDTVSRCRQLLPPDHPEAWQDVQRARKSKVCVCGGEWVGAEWVGGWGGGAARYP